MTYACENRSCPRHWKRFRGRASSKCRCRTCGSWCAPVKPLRADLTAPGVIPDIPEHFNLSIGEVVRNRAHLRQIQKERGLQDYEPLRGSNGAELSREAVRNRGRVIFNA